MMKRLLGLSLLVSMSAQASWFDSAEVKAVKGAKLNACPSVTLEQMVDSYMGSPKWRSLEFDGRQFVNISGGILFNDKPVDALLQFELHDDDSLNIHAMELNEIPQNQLVSMGLIEAMCESAIEEHPPEPIESGQVEAIVYGVETAGEEAIEITTNKGNFIMNASAMSVGEIVTLETAAMEQQSLCFLGTDAIYKDNLSKRCSE